MPYLRILVSKSNRKHLFKDTLNRKLLRDQTRGVVCLEKVGISLKVLKYPTEFLKKIDEIFASVSEKFQENVTDVYIV
jgi:hypothetical protein